MKLKKIMAVGLVMAMTASMAACGGKSGEAKSDKSDDTANVDISYADIKLGDSYKDLKATIRVFNHRTDLSASDYKGTNWDTYIKEFNKMYPNIEVNVETDSNYAEDALIRLQGGDWGDIMMIPAVDKPELSTYFMSYGDQETMKDQINYSGTWMYDDQVYGVPSTANASGIVYNKKVFENAGVTSENIPKKPEEFQKVLKAIAESNEGKSEDEKVIPLYTNYANGWPMSQWDPLIGGTATGDASYMNNKFLHTKDPFQNYGDDTHAYAVYKVLYDAVASGYTEEDFSTTVWEDSKRMINEGKIGCMVLGSWAIPQMQSINDKNADDIAFMSFPITVDGKQYATSGADYCYAINKDVSKEQKEAALVFVKWMTEESGYSFNECGLPIKAGEDHLPDAFQACKDNDIDFITDDVAQKGEEDLLSKLNADSELNFNNGGDSKVQAIVEAADSGEKKFDDIMKEWNDAWSDAQESNDVEVK